MDKIRFLIALLALLAASVSAWVPAAFAADQPRTIIGLYADHTDLYIDDHPLFDDHSLFQAAEMPLNYLGLVLESYNVVREIPKLADRNDVRGVLMWLQHNDLPDPDAVIEFLEAAVRQGVPVIMLEQLPTAVDADGNASPAHVARALGLIGVRELGSFQPYTFDTRVVAIDESIAGFERRFDGVLPPVDTYAAMGDAEPVLVLEHADGSRTSPILITPKGAYVASGYALWNEESGERAQWLINPFGLFARVYKTDALPKADPTTLSGRRIYYSHIDGDGWLNRSLVGRYREQNAYSSEVILREAVVPYPDLPVTVAPIAADLDPAFAGTVESQALARAFFARPQVEVGSHTYTHPFQWSYFAPENYDPADEFRFRDIYPALRVDPDYDGGTSTTEGTPLEEGYVSPRAYGDIPFDLNKEIEGAAAYISSFAPEGKPVRVLQWSGDTNPFAEAIAEANKAGLVNINGGDTRRDNRFPSYTSVAPYGRLVAGQRQIYTSGSNENIYTNGWTRNFGAFRQVLMTIANTETPYRVTAVNIYYHMYSGEREAALRALKEALDAVSLMELTPVATSHYVEIAQGFYTARFEPAGAMAWRVRDRGALATIRFDGAAQLNVDYARSQGVLGDRHVGGVLYVALDGADAAPLIALQRGRARIPARLVLNDSRWEIAELRQAGTEVWFRALGFGPGEMRWRTAPGQIWRIEVTYPDRIYSTEAAADDDGLLSFSVPRGAERGAAIRMVRVTAGGA